MDDFEHGEFDPHMLSEYITALRLRDQHHGKQLARKFAEWILREGTRRGMREHVLARLGPYARMINAAPAPPHRYGGRWEAEAGGLHVDRDEQLKARHAARTGQQSTIEQRRTEQDDQRQAFVDHWNNLLNGR